ncbi:peptidyl-prolyl cis-trans isomerase CYP95-like isoform X1 [Tripterygium wilfordii]|uniref:peptidylprolyl isomerase n=1 Tax=Tripterygium wilfordii TaxID=458696 RepID=A0A7J7DQ29_TRIWF|nr:peptidyl-prolyl cis-trans isomerase CYP95-like isoform X2 [Tripterygium wilfordii]KAF5748206.1 peptidyl-prolyl cis-trans isomerase CYP95-like isoform X1 [Tripterygium wilfordii]
MAKKKNTLVFMDVSIDGDPIERMVFELFYDVAPKTAENFRSLCTGEKGIGPKTGRPLHFKGTFFHRIIRCSMAEGGDLLRQDGAGGESIYGGKFPDESPQLKHDGPGLLSMSISDRDISGSIFIITFKASHHLDRKYVVFGKLVKGDEVLQKIEHVGDEEGRPAVTVKVIKCGEFNEDLKKESKLKVGKDASPDANSHELRKRGKHKKSSRNRRKKRRRYYSSDTESSSSSEIESSESDSDSDSSLLSSTDDTSSSDDRRKKRKRSSKSDKYRRLKRRDRKRDKKRKRRDKRSRHRLRRASDGLSNSERESKSGSSSRDGLDAQEEGKKSAIPSLVTGDEAISVRRKWREEAGIIEKESSRFPKENGERHSNGIEADAQSNGSADREPDVVDDHPGKSRSRSMSPRRTMSKSMSISPRKSRSRSPSDSPKRSRSPSVGRSPPVIRRSISRSPARSVSSRSPSVIRSPVGGRKARSISRSPVRVQSRRSISRSPEKSLSRRGLTRSPARTSSRRSFSRSPVRSSRRSISRSSGRAPSRRSISRSPIKPPSRNTHRKYSRSPSPVRRARSRPARGRSLSRSGSPDESSKRIRRGRGFSQRYSFARQYRTPSPDRSPVRYNRYGGRVDRDRYSSYRRYSPRRYRSPLRGRTPPRYKSRRSRTRSPSVSRRRSRTRSPSVSRSPVYRSRRFSHSRSPIRSRSPVEVSVRRRSPLRSRSPSKSHSSLEPHSPRQPSKDRSRSSSGSPGNKKGLVSYDDGSPDSGQR